jgi:putative exosortase-associated protein (TIGR04073 family)
MALIILSFASLAYAKGPGDKLVRGVANIFSGWLEIPQTIGEEWKASNNMAVGVVAGAIKGTVHTVCRFASGIWDVFTFPIAVPDNYEPIYSPDYVYQ